MHKNLQTHICMYKSAKQAEKLKFEHEKKIIKMENELN